MGQRRPVTAKELEVGALRGGQHRSAGAAFVAVELAGKERLERERVARELHHVDLEAVPLSEAAVCRHEYEAGVALGLHDAVPPGLELLSAGRRGEDGGECSCHRGADECIHDRSPFECITRQIQVSCRIRAVDAANNVTHVPRLHLCRYDRIMEAELCKGLRRGEVDFRAQRRKSGEGVRVYREIGNPLTPPLSPPKSDISDFGYSNSAELG